MKHNDLAGMEGNNSCNKINLEKPFTYDFDNNIFIVKSVFKDKSNETLGTVLIRLMTSDE